MMIMISVIKTSYNFHGTFKKTLTTKSVKHISYFTEVLVIKQNSSAGFVETCGRSISNSEHILPKLMMIKD